MTVRVLPAAVLWDMDGTLIDSEPYWIAAETALAARFGIEWTVEDGMSLVGNPLDTSALILRDRGVDLEAHQIIATLLSAVATSARERMPWMPDARALLDGVRAAGIPCALVTMSQGEFVEVFLDEVGDAFDAVVTGDQVRKGKPDPEAYTLAAHKLGVEISACVAIEDSPVGVRSAHAAGAVTVGVKRHVDLPALEGAHIVDGLDGMDVDALAELVRRRRLPDYVVGRTPVAASTASGSSVGGAPPNSGHND